jgi:hypothetical protein
MVLAILDDLKTKTRRIIKHRHYDLTTAEFLRMSVGVDGVAIAIFRVASGEEVSVRCPYGAAGHQLWVREAWAVQRHEPCEPHERDYQELIGPTIRYLANGATRKVEGDRTTGVGVFRGRVESGRPSIHMPRWASRIQLQIISVTVERVQSITDAEGLAEGVRHASLGDTVWSGFMGVPRATCPGRTAFALLWMDINGVDAWNSDPWVWAVEFKRVPHA